MGGVPVFKGLTREENIKILCNCSKQQDYTNTMGFLLKRFKERKIPHKFVNQRIAPHKSRNLYLFEKQVEKKIPFVSFYNWC